LALSTPLKIPYTAPKPFKRFLEKSAQKVIGVLGKSAQKLEIGRTLFLRKNKVHKNYILYSMIFQRFYHWSMLLCYYVITLL
jgi:hypothetical protein